MKTIYLVFLCLFFVGCKNNIKQEIASDKQLKIAVDSLVMKVPDDYWSITGTEPFWSIYIHKDTVVFTKLNEKIDTVFFIQEHFNSVGINSNYELTDSEKNSATLNINEEKCSDGMSDKQYQYSAIFIYKDVELKGCAEKNNDGK